MTAWRFSTQFAMHHSFHMPLLLAQAGDLRQVADVSTNRFAIFLMSENHPQLPIQYRAARWYSAPRLWKTLKKATASAGRKTLLTALTLFYCLKDSDTPTWAKGVIVGALGYLVLPVDAIPDILPGVGYGDDWGAIVSALGIVAAYIKDEHKAKATAQVIRLLGPGNAAPRILSMKFTAIILSLLVTSLLATYGAVSIDEEVFGKSLGGWTKRDKAAAEYSLSGSTYRTYKPETSATPEGGIFISVRIDHIRGWLSSDDHAILEITVSPKGSISSAQSNIAIQGKSITSEVILSGAGAGKVLLAPDAAVQVGTDLIADLSAKLLRENIVEAGRVSFPAVLRHNYNKLFQAIRVDAPPAPTVATSIVPPSPEPEKPKEIPTIAPPVPPSAPLEVKPLSPASKIE
mgnify:CR=1 FL=1